MLRSAQLFSSEMKTPGKPLGVMENGFCALAAGGLAALVGNPADLALIRMQAPIRTAPKAVPLLFDGHSFVGNRSTKRSEAA